MDVGVRVADAAPSPKVSYDGVIVGDSIHAAHHSKALTGYLRDRVDALNGMSRALR
jgi:menaquinone-dependent protoporphyrinogen IX oxidase